MPLIINGMVFIPSDEQEVFNSLFSNISEELDVASYIETYTKDR